MFSIRELCMDRLSFTSNKNQGRVGPIVLRPSSFRLMT